MEMLIYQTCSKRRLEQSWKEYHQHAVVFLSCFKLISGNFLGSSFPIPRFFSRQQFFPTVRAVAVFPLTLLPSEFSDAVVDAVNACLRVDSFFRPHCECKIWLFYTVHLRVCFIGLDIIVRLPRLIGDITLYVPGEMSVRVCFYTSG